MNPDRTPRRDFLEGPGQAAAREQLEGRAAKLRTGAASGAFSAREGPAAGRDAPPAPDKTGAVRKRRMPSPPHSPRKEVGVPRSGSSGGGRQATVSGWRVPVVWLKNVVGLFLLPLAWVWTVSFVGLFGKATVHHRFWMTEDFWFFTLGGILWLVAFSGSLYVKGEPPLLKWYIFVHEWTHAIWAYQSNGRVDEIEVNEDHGHILTNKPTALVTLAPYFYPAPCVVLILLFAPFALFYPLEEAPPIFWGMVPPMGVFLGLMGLGWAFHFTYTIWMIRKGQSDLRMHGNFFSLVVIYIVNLIVVTVFLVASAAGVEWRTFFRELLHNTEDFSDVAWRFLCHAWALCRSV